MEGDGIDVAAGDEDAACLLEVAEVIDEDENVDDEDDAVEKDIPRPEPETVVMEEGLDPISRPDVGGAEVLLLLFARIVEVMVP